MISSIYSYLIVSLFLCYECTNTTESTTPLFNGTGKVVGGKDTTIEKYPFIVSLQKKGFGHYCGASILSTTWVLSAAHCCLQANTSINPPDCCYILAGVNDSTEIVSRDAQMVKILGYIYHPEYHKTRYTNDIACIKLEHNLTFTAQISPVQLPNKFVGDLSSSVGNAIVIGWGSRDQFRYQNILQEASLPVISFDECKAKVRYVPVTKGHVCTMVKSGERDACFGDSGGPLLAPNNEIIGIVSFGKGCGQYNTPSVYTRVDQFLTFISDCQNGLLPFSRGTCSSRYNILLILSVLFQSIALHFSY